MTPAVGDNLSSLLRRTLCAGARDGVPDEELLGQFVAQRDEAAFAALLRRHGPLVWGVCQRLLAHRQDAEDAFQTTFLVLARKAAAVGRRQLLANWLFGVARRAALNVRAGRSRRARQEQSRSDLPDVPAPGEMPWDDGRAVLDEELARLPEKYRLPLLLCGLEGRTHAEAGQWLGWPTGTVAGRLSRGRALLRARLLRRGVAAPAAASAAALAPDTAPAAVPPPLVAASVHGAAALVTAGPSTAAGVSPAVAALLRGVLRKMFLSRLLTTTALIAALTTALGGAGLLWQRAPSATSAFAPAGVAPGQFHLAAAAPSLAPPPAPKPAGKPALRLPADPKAVVFRMERAVEGAPGPRVVLTIHADGRVVTEVPDGLSSLSAQELTGYAKDRAGAPGAGRGPLPQKKAIQGKISARELEDLLRFAVRDQEFFDFDEAAVRAAIRERYQSDGGVEDDSDATTTRFRVRTAGGSHEVSWTRLAKSAFDFPEVGRLLQLNALDRRLSHVFYRQQLLLLAGGPERVEEVVGQMNELARPSYRLYPGAPRLTAADLAGVTPSADGSRTRFVFARYQDTGKSYCTLLFGVAVDVPRQGKPTLAHVLPPQEGTRGRAPARTGVPS
jgi:RNA polymerase sigma factor (sigma-70 family)